MGVYSKLNRPIHVKDYDPGWPALFEQEKARILALLGDRVLLVEHIGSTAVPGLAAKPVIDIAIGVRSLSHARLYIPLIESLAYVYEPTLELALPERYFFWKGTETAHTCHLHVAEVDHLMLARPIRFRDYLREHPQVIAQVWRIEKGIGDMLRPGHGRLRGRKKRFYRRCHANSAERDIKHLHFLTSRRTKHISVWPNIHFHFRICLCSFNLESSQTNQDGTGTGITVG